jgi:hypothetical protein
MFRRVPQGQPAVPRCLAVQFDDTRLAAFPRMLHVARSLTNVISMLANIEKNQTIFAGAKVNALNEVA